MTAKKKDFSAAALRGAELFFSANDVQQPIVQEAHDVQDAQEKRPVHIMYNAEQAQDAQEVNRFREERRTQGRKGCSMQRMNISLTPTAYDYVKTMARLKNKTFSEIINGWADESREKNKELYQKAQALLRDI